MSSSSRFAVLLSFTVTVVSVGFLNGFQVLGDEDKIKIAEAIEKNAQQEGAVAENHGVTVFEEIVKGKAAAEKLFEDDLCMVIKDILPQAPVHFLVIPKRKITSMSDIQDEDKMLMGHMMLVASQVAKQENVDGAYRVGNTLVPLYNGLPFCQIKVAVIGRGRYRGEGAWFLEDYEAR